MKKVLTIAVAIMLLAVSGFAQEENKAFFAFNVDVAAGYGSMLGEEGDTFSQDAQFVAGHVDVLDINLFDSTSGVGVEVQLGGEDLQYQVWSLNRAVVPGTNGRIYGGSDLKLLQSTDEGGADANFDLRLVTGYVLGAVGPGQLRFEMRFIEENRPMAFAVLYAF